MKACKSLKLFRFSQRRILDPRLSNVRLLSSAPRLRCSSHGGRNSLDGDAKPAPPLLDHRQLGAAYDLFSTTPYSPGSPLLHPDGSHIFLQLQAFLRAQYAAYGFQEVVTPNIYKKELWERSGHWANYRADMFTVTGGSQAQKSTGTAPPEEDDAWGLKPMNCPAHCLLFASRPRSYRDLPLRLADFGALHRNEVSGALAGLTRVRRFHQDDGHIFCTPAQVGPEIARTLQLVDLVYTALDMAPYRLVLSTRPPAQGNAEAEGALGTEAEWADAEAQLRAVLEASDRPWTVAEGEGAFYGPKIDIVVTDTQGREHQTATVQLDFQLPRRFQLEYTGPGADTEKATPQETPERLASEGPAKHTPVMIHRAVLGSAERFLALLLEKHQGRLPFWLSPRQLAIITTNSSVNDYAQEITNTLSGATDAHRAKLQPLDTAPTGSRVFCVDVDTRAEPLAGKIREAEMRGYALVAVVGPKEAEQRTVTLRLPGRWQGDGKARLRARAVELGMRSDKVMASSKLGELMRRLTAEYL